MAATRGRPPHRLFGIQQSDRMFHQYIIGQTGTGKSSLLLQMMKQDLNSGQGFCLIDPHGDLARAVLEIDSNNVIYWNAADPACPYGYNPLTTIRAEFRPLVASGLIETLKKQWSDAWGARMEHLLRYSLLALLDRPGSNLQDIIPMFLDKDFRGEVLSYVSDPQVRQFWYQEFPNMNYKSAADGVAPIANKLGAFLAHPVVRKAVCAPEQPLRFRQIMDEGKVLVVNLSKGKLGSDVSNLLGGMIVSNIAHAAYSRESQPEPERKQFFLYIDEFHSFTTEVFANMISELRKYRLGLVLAHQYTAQLNKEVFEAVLGNVGTLMAFRVGVTDAAIMAKQFGADVPQPSDLVNLANYEMFIKLMINGKQSQVFSGHTTL
ncbi:MAG: type IV secretion system DNA-binding domain-containing protein [Rhizobiaceae bacterium]